MFFGWGVTVFLLASACTSTTLAEPAGDKQPTAPPLVGPLRSQRAIRGCNWSVSVPTLEGSYYLLAEIDDSVVLMNVGGRDVKLRRLEGRDGAGPRGGWVLVRPPNPPLVPTLRVSARSAAQRQRSTTAGHSEASAGNLPHAGWSG